MTKSGRFTPPPQQTVIYGTPMAQALEAELERLGARRVVLVTDSRSRKATDLLCVQRRLACSAGDRNG